MLLGSQCNGTPATSQNVWQRLVKRLTRFWSCKNLEKTVADIIEYTKARGYEFHIRNVLKFCYSNSMVFQLFGETNLSWTNYHINKRPTKESIDFQSISYSKCLW